MAKDIRRESGDISPVNYIRPGVEDTSASTLVAGLGEAAVTLDKQLAEQRLGKALKTLEDQYVSGGSPVIAAAQDKVAGQEDVDVGPTLTANDQRSLKDFAQVLDDHDNAVRQGRMTQDMFRIRAERLYKIALSKRPGLAQEFRQVASDVLGIDVVGSTLDVLKAMEGAQLREAASEADLAAQGMKKKHDTFIDRAKTLNIAIPSNITPYTPEFDQWIDKVNPAMNKMLGDVQVAEDTKRTAETLQAKGQIDIGANTMAFENQVNAEFSAAWGSLSSAVTNLENTGQINDPASVRAELLKLKTGLDGVRSRLSATGKSLRLDNDTIGLAMSRLEKADQELSDLLSNENQAKIVQNGVNWIRAQEAMTQLGNDQIRRASVFLGMFPGEIASSLTAKYGANLAVIAGDSLAEGASPKLMAANGYNILTSTLPQVFSPNSDATPQTVAAAALLVEKALQSMYLIPDRDYDINNFLSQERGILTALNNRARDIEQKFTPEQKESLAMDFAGAFANAIRMKRAMLQAKFPAMKGRTSFDLAAPNGQIIVLKDATPAETKAVREANASLRLPTVLNVTQTLTGAKTAQEAAAFLASQYVPTMNTIKQDAARRARMSAAQARTQAQAKAAGTGTTNPAVPAVGTVVRGWRFKGGDPASKASWEKVQ